MPTAKIINDGDEQIILLPPECAIFNDGQELEISREGDRVVLRPAKLDPATDVE